MKIAFRAVAALGLLTLLGGAVFLGNLIWFRPFFVDHFFERVFLETALRDPELLTSTRFLKPFGLEFYHDDLSDLSDAHAETEVVRAKKVRATLESYDDGDLEPQQLLSKKILQAYLEPQIELGEKYSLHNYPINQLFGYQNGWPSFMTNQHWIEDEDDVRAYISRMSQLSRAFAQLKAGMEDRADQGIAPPTFVIDKVRSGIEKLISTPAPENALITTFVAKAEAAGLDPDVFRADVLQALQDQVYPAYANLSAFLEGFRSRTTTDDGVWKLPNGETFYELKLWEMTTLKITAQAIHDRGLAEVARIQAEMLTILEAEGYPTEEGFQVAMKALTEDPNQYFEGDAGREAILEGYREIIKEIEAELEPWFNRRHANSVEVKRVPEFREASAPGAYYESPPLDGSRPGRFFANLYDLKATPKWGMRTLTFHEAVPGHHLQIAVARELTGVPTFRKLIPFTAYIEGWALYAERLAYEMGLEEAPLDNLGRLQAELFRAVRLVVDTGLHRFRWSRERAIDYMKSNLGMPESDIVAEVERYIVLPGQATAYKVGMDFILGERDRARQALGDRFDIRAFHDAVLENGAVPLTVLRQLIDRFIERNAVSVQK